MMTAATKESSAAVTATGARQERGTASSPSSADITLHSRSAGALAEESGMDPSSRAVFDMAACRAWHLRHDSV